MAGQAKSLSEAAKAGEVRVFQAAKAGRYGCFVPLIGSCPGVRRGVGGYSVGPYARCFLGCIDKRMWGSPSGATRRGRFHDSA